MQLYTMAANTPTIVSHMDKELLKCSVCLERYRDPKILRCHHSFCEQCLEGLLKQNGGFFCPVCRRRHNVTSIQQLPPSRMLNNIMDIIDGLKSQHIEENNLCHGCRGNVSRNRCVDCAMDFCETCTTVHGSLPMTQQHRILTTEEFGKARVRDKSIVVHAVHCTEHEYNLVDLYCNTCLTPICLLCLRSEHNEHNVIDLQAAADKFKSEISNHIKQLNIKQTQVRENKSRAIKQFQELTEQHNKQEQQILQHSKAQKSLVLSKIEEQEGTALRTLHKHFNTLNKNLEKEIRHHEESDELLTGTIMYVEDFLKYTSTAQQVIKCAETINQMSVLETLDTEGCDEVPGKLPQFHPSNITVQGDIGTFEKSNQASNKGNAKLVRHTNDPSTSSNTVCSAQRKWRLNATLSKFGSEVGKFNSPNGLIVNRHGEVMVTDMGNERIQIMDLCGRPKQQIQFTGYSKPVRPWDIAESLDGRYFVTDCTKKAYTGNNQVVVCDDKGRVIQSFKTRLNNPSGIAINHEKGVVYVLDRNAHCIRLFQVSDYKYIKSIGKFGHDQCEFNGPHFIAINSKGHVIVSDTFNDRVQVLTPDGGFLFEFSGCQENKLRRPVGVATGGRDDIYVCNRNPSMGLQVFDSTGVFKYSVDLRDGKMETPSCIDVTNYNEMVVTSHHMHCVKILLMGQDSSCNIL